MAPPDSPVGQVRGRGESNKSYLLRVGWGKTHPFLPIGSFLSLGDRVFPNREEVTLYLPIGAELGWNLKLSRADWQSLGPMASG